MDVGSYRIDSLVTQTPLGALYAGTARGSSQAVLVYRLRDALRDDPRLVAKIQAQARLLREARVPGLPKLLDAGRLPDRTLYTVFAPLGGGTLSSAIARHQQTGASTDALAVEIGQRLSRILARAHAEGVFHLTLTPGQVLLSQDDDSEDRVGLLGVGMATLLGRTAHTTWDPEHTQYAAPEQRAGESAVVSAATDVYALGVLLGQLLRDRADLQALIRQMCADDPAQRPSMADVASQLQVTQPSALPPRDEPQRRPRVRAAFGGADKPSDAAAATQPDASVAERVAATANIRPDARPAAKVESAAPGAEPSVDSEPIGARFGNFRVVRKLGEGGMGIVYEAEHEQIGRRAAVKILHGRYAENDAYARRFLNEARAVNIVRHPGLVEIFEFGKLSDGTLFYIMEYLQGESLERRIDTRRGPFPQEEAVNIALQVARALAAAHDKHIVHRDLKPGNIMFVPDPVNPGLDWVKVLDFGIAKVRTPLRSETDVANLAQTEEQTGHGTRMGTPLYMAPEQHGGAEDADGRADVFSLGVVLYEMLAGQAPFRNNSLSLLIAKPTPIEKLNPKVSPTMATLIRSMMATEAEERPTMRQVEERLAGLLGKRRPPWRWIGLAGAALLALIVAGIVLWGRSPTPAELRGQAMETLKRALAQGEPGTQSLAATVIGQSRDLDARTLLVPIVSQRDVSPTLREAAVRALAELGDVEAQPQLLELLSDSMREKPGGSGLTVAVASALAQLEQPRGTEVLKQLLQRGDELSRVQAALALLERGDFSGSDLLWARIGHGAVTARTLTQVLGRLALSGDERAKNRLTQEFAGRSGGEGRVYVAYALARLGEEAPRAYLRQLAKQLDSSGSTAPKPDSSDGSEALLAARLLFALGETPRTLAQAGFEKNVKLSSLLAVAADATQPDARRELALSALGDSGDLGVLLDLGRILRSRGAGPRVQVATAGTILALLAGDAARSAEQSLRWARSALSSDSAAARELAVLALGDLDNRAAGDVLGAALRDPDAQVRKQAARQLGRFDSNPLHALNLLRQTLRDRDRDVRLAGVEAISQALRSEQRRRQRPQGERSGDTIGLSDLGAEQTLRQELQAQGEPESELDRVVVSGLLFQLGDRSRRPQLLAGLSSKDPLVRKVTVQLLVGAGAAAGDVTAAERALSDSDRSVRLAAALQLAEAGQKQGVAVLRSFVSGGELDGLVAYRALRRLGETSEPPAGLGALLRSGDLVTRYAVVDGTRDLPRAVALPLLQLASLDPASVVRRKVVAVSAALYRPSREGRLLLLIGSLRGDSDIIVRNYAAQILAELLPDGTAESAARRSASDAATGSPGEPASDPASASGAGRAPDKVPAADPTPGSAESRPSSADSTAQLILEGEEGVRVQIDRTPPHVLSDKPIVLSAGKHSLRYTGGGQDIQLAPGQILRLRVPVRLSDQLLTDGRDALGKKDLGRAQESLERLRRLLGRSGRGSQGLSLQADLAFELARLHEARGQIRDALAEYNRCLGVPEGSRRPELNIALNETLRRLSGRAGRIQIFTQVNGRCVMTQELLLPPGEQIVSIGKGQTRTVFSQLGSTTKLMACQ